MEKYQRRLESLEDDLDKITKHGDPQSVMEIIEDLEQKIKLLTNVHKLLYDSLEVAVKKGKEYEKKYMEEVYGHTEKDDKSEKDTQEKSETPE